INVTVSNAGSALNVTSAGGTVNVTVSNAGSPLNVSEVGITGSVFNMTNPGYVIPDYSNLTAVRSTNMTSSSGIVSNFTWGGQTGLRNHLVAFSYSGNFTHLATGAPLIKITCTGSAGQTNTVWQKLWATGAPFAAESYEFNPIPLNCSAGQNMTFEIMNRTITGALTNAISAAEQAGGANFFFNIVGYSAP
ncbi:hypothetical protein HYS54_05440, partial [Candidatus Micrarchaeota archaeon]|nr:hypothetical protein [Candidatus Micrarchaeota archaeon]